MASEMVDLIDWSHPTQSSTPCAHRIALYLHSAVWAANRKACCTERSANVRPSECQAEGSVPPGVACAATQAQGVNIYI